MDQQPRQQQVKPQQQPIFDSDTGIQNDNIRRESITIKYQSCKTNLSIQEDECNLKKYQLLKEETFQYYKKQVGPLNNIALLTQLIADVEYIFSADHASGSQKLQLVYDSFLQFLYLLPNINYDTYTKSNIINLIEEIFKAHKKELKDICIKFHPGLQSKKGLCH